MGDGGTTLISGSGHYAPGDMNGNGQERTKEPVERVIDLFVHMPIGFAVMAWKRVPEFVVSVPGLVGEVLSKSCAHISDAEGRLSEEVRKARMIGQVAVTFGGRQLRREVDARLRDARHAAGGVASFLPGAGGPNGSGAGPAGGVSATATRAPTKPTGARKTTKASPAKTTKGSPATTTKGSPAKTTKASPATTAKSSGAAKAPARSAARAAAAAASAADLPIREYDGLSASQVVSRLSGLTPDELRAVRAYEDASRGRRTVLLAIDRLLG